MCKIFNSLYICYINFKLKKARKLKEKLKKQINAELKKTKRMYPYSYECEIAEYNRILQNYCDDFSYKKHIKK